MMDSVGRITLAARKGRGKDAAKEVYIAALYRCVSGPSRAFL